MIGIVLLYFLIGTVSSVEAQPLAAWVAEARKNLVTELLPNGLTVLCYPVPNTYKVHVGITYDVGGKDELPHECGLAHMVEHMIFKGTEKMAETDVKEIAHKYHVDRGSYNATTTSDLTRYFFHADSTSWPIFLNVLADCMYNVRFDENHFSSEVKAVVAELNLRSAVFGAIVGDEIGALMYPHNHPYHHPVGGYKEILLRSTSADLKRFYARNYHPKKALLTIIGDIEVAEALAAARAAFAIPAATDAHVEALQEAPSAEVSQKKITVYKPLSRAHYTYLWKISNDLQQGEVAACYAWVLTQRLHKRLVDERNLVYSFVAESFQKQLGGVFLYTFDPKNRADFKEIRKIIRDEREKLTLKGPTTVELQRYQKLAELSFCKVFETCSTIAEALEQHYFPSRSTDDFFSSLERTKRLTIADLQEFGRSSVKESLHYSLCCLPISADGQTEWLAKKQEEDAYEQKILQGKIRHTGIDPARYVHQLPTLSIPPYKPEQPDTECTLSNGLNVYVKKIVTTPFVSCVLAFKHAELCGITQSIASQRMAHVLGMKMLTHNSSKHFKDEHQEFFDTKGAHVTFTSDGMHVTCLPEDFSDVVTRAVHMLKEPAYNAQAVAQECSSLIDQFTMFEKSPDYMVDHLLKMKLFKQYPWIHSHSELCTELQALKRADLVRFNERFINPENMFLVVTGAIDLAKITDDLESVFGGWRNHKASQELSYREIGSQIRAMSDRPVRITETIYPMPVDQIYLALGRMTDFYDSKAIVVLSLIESYVHNRIFAIRELTGAFYAFRSTLSHSSLYQKGFAEIMVPVSLSNAAQIEETLKNLIMTIGREGIPCDVISASKESFQMQLLKEQKTPEALALRFASLISHNSPLDSDEVRLRTVQSLTKEEIDAVVRSYFDPTTWSVVKVGRLQQERSEDDTIAYTAEEHSRGATQPHDKKGLWHWLLSKIFSSRT